MERILETSLDDQYELERRRKAVDLVLNRQLLWIMLPLGIAFAVAAYYLDISTRIAIPVLEDMLEHASVGGGPLGYDVFRLDLWAFVRLVPSALIAGAAAILVAVFVGTKYRQSFIAPMYALIGLIYSLLFTALLGFLIPLNVWIVNKAGFPITDSEIPFSNEITSFGNAPNVFPFSYLLTGMERGIWAASGVVIFALVAMWLPARFTAIARYVRPLAASWVLAVLVVALLLIGPVGLQQFLFERFVQFPEFSEPHPLMMP